MTEYELYLYNLYMQSLNSALDLTYDALEPRKGDALNQLLNNQEVQHADSNNNSGSSNVGMSDVYSDILTGKTTTH